MSFGAFMPQFEKKARLWDMPMRKTWLTTASGHWTQQEKPEPATQARVEFILGRHDSSICSVHIYKLICRFLTLIWVRWEHDPRPTEMADGIEDYGRVRIQASPMIQDILLKWLTWYGNGTRLLQKPATQIWTKRTWGIGKKRLTSWT